MRTINRHEQPDTIGNVTVTSRMICLGVALIVCGATFPAVADQERDQSIAWYRSQFVEPYAKHNQQTNAWDHDALKALDGAAQRYAGTTNCPSREQVGTLAKSAIDAGCNDPLVLSVYYIFLRLTQQRGADGELEGPGEIWLRKALEGFRQSDYPKCRTMDAALSVALLEKRTTTGAADSSKLLASEAVDAAIQAILNKEYRSASAWERTKFNDDMDYLCDMCERAGLNTAEAFERILDRVSGKTDYVFIEQLDKVASHERVADHREWEALERRAKKLLRTEKFDELETMASELRDGKLRFHNGEWQSVRFYDALALWYKSPPEDWKKRFELVERWTKAKPDSASAQLVLARTHFEYAWNARGGGYANNVNEDGWRLFNLRLKKAREVLWGINPKNREDPEWYRLNLMILALDSWRTGEYHQCLRRALLLELDYDWFYKLTAWYSLPRWYGEAGDWVKVAEAAANDSADDGDSLYARVAWHIWDSVDGSKSQLDGRFFDENHVSWPRMRQGFQAMERRHPESLWNLNAFCRFACMAKDKEIARELFRRIGKDWDAAVWGYRFNYENCRAWAKTP